MTAGISHWAGSATGLRYPSERDIEPEARVITLDGTRDQRLVTSEKGHGTRVWEGTWDQS